MHKELFAMSGRKIGRRSVLAGGAALLAMPFIARPGFAAGKALRISTPGTAEEWQSKGLVKFKEELDKAMPGRLRRADPL